MINKRDQLGMLSIDGVFVLILVSILLTLGTYWTSKQMAAQDHRIAADKQRIVAEAVSKYLKDNFSVVLASATPTSPAEITIAMLRNTNYLPTGFSDTNGFGQAIVGLARKPNPDQLEVIVLTTGGQPISEIGIREVAENLGGPGGFVSSMNPSVIQGVRGGWQVALSNFGVNPGAGHTASALFLMDGELANDYLYRNAVPGQPQLNTMNTVLNMGGNAIDNVGSITASGAITTSQSVNATDMTATGTITGGQANIAGETYTGGWFRTRGDTGWFSEKWGGGIYQTDSDWVRVYNDKGLRTGGAVDAGSITSKTTITATGRLATSEYISIGGIATEGTACSDSKLLAKTSSGGALTCQSGMWTSIATDIAFYEFDMAGVGYRYRGIGKVSDGKFWGDAWCTANVYCGTTGYNYCGSNTACVNTSGQYANNTGRVGLASMPVYNLSKMPGW